MLGLGTFAGVVKELRRDVAAARDRDPAARGVGPAEIVATWPGIQALLSHRVAHALHEAGVPLLPRTISMLTRALTGIEIHPAAQIGKGLFIDHGAGRGDRRDGDDRRRRDALPGRDARRHRLRRPASATRRCRTT